MYGYTSILFGLISDSRLGFHSQVDVRDYFVVGGHKPIDDSLIDRVLKTLVEVQDFQRRHDQSLTKGDLFPEDIRVLSKPGDFVMSHANLSEPLSHLLGPKADQIGKLCESMIFTKIRKQLGASEEDHCFQCH